MPAYDYKCKDCGYTETYYQIPYDARFKLQMCSECGYWAEYQFPIEALNGFQPFAPYYDECLDGDITSRRDRKEFLKAEGLEEAGDKRGGSRFFDKHAPHHIKPMPPTGVSVWQSREQQKREVEKANKMRDVEGLG